MYTFAATLKISTMKKKVLLTCFITTVAIVASAQGFTITGKVVDAATNEPLIGVSVSNAKSYAGTITDYTGAFSLQADKGDVLQFFYVGYRNDSIRVNDSQNVVIRLAEEVQQIDEVVVVGAAMKKSDLTGAIGSVSAEELTDIPTVNLNQALQGKVAGVFVVSSPQPGTDASIKIRGSNSISYGTNPLYVIDNIMIDGSDISTINPNDIASIEVLKDASATALYGARAANGVIVITTKKGQKGKGKVTYDGWVGWKNFANTVPTMSGREVWNFRVNAFINGEMDTYREKHPGKDEEYYQKYRDFYINRYLVCGSSQSEKYSDPKYIDSNKAFMDWEIAAYEANQTYNWVDAIAQQGFSQNHNLTFSGATDAANYYLSFGLSDEKGQIKKTDYRRYNGKVNLDFKVNKWLKVGTNNSLAFSQSNPLVQDNMYLLAFRANPLFPITSDEYYMWDGKLESQAFHNPLRSLETVTKDVDKFRFLTSDYININPVKGLDIRSTFSFDFAQQENNTYYGVESTECHGSNTAGQATQYRTRSMNWQWDNTVSYNTTIREKHRLGVMVGMNMSYHSDNYNTITALNFGNDLFTYKSIQGATDKEHSSFYSGYTSYSLMSAYLRLNYVYDSRYYVTLTGRADGSSKFSQNNKWGYFPSVALSWNITGEQFMKDQHVVDNLRLRLGYGLVGNQNIPNYSYYTLFSPTTTLDSYILRNSGIYGNPNLKWETQKQANIGLDLGFWHNRLNMTLDYFYTRNEDLLMQRSLASSYGYSYMIDNVGCLENQGVEFTFNLEAIQTKDWKWNIGFNLSHDKNKIISLYDNVDAIYSSSGTSINRYGNLFVGQPLNNIYVYEFDHIMQDTPEDWEYVNSMDFGGTTVMPGDIIPKDRNGDGKISDADKYVYGKTDPIIYGALQTNLSWKGISLQVICNYSYGAHKVSSLYESLMSSTGTSATHTDNLNSWSPTNTNTNIPRAYYTTSGKSRYSLSSVDLGIQDASFFKLSAVTLSYDFPRTWMNKIHFDHIRVYFTGNNLACATKYKGYDPESGDDYPSSRTYVVGLNIGF